MKTLRSRPVSGRAMALDRQAATRSSEALAPAFGPGARGGKGTGGRGRRHSRGRNPSRKPLPFPLLHQKRGQSPLSPRAPPGEKSTPQPLRSPLPTATPSAPRRLHARRIETQEGYTAANRSGNRTLPPDSTNRLPELPTAPRNRLPHPSTSTLPSLQVRATSDQGTARKQISCHSAKGSGLEPRESTWPVTL